MVHNRGVSADRKHERGAILVLALIMLAIILAIIPILVAFINSGARSSIMYERKNNELYTADAGVQDAIQFLKNCTSLPMDTIPYNLQTKYGQDVNDRSGQVTVSPYIKDGIQYYKIFSQGQTLSGEETTITAFVNAFDAYGWAHADNAFMSPETLDFKSGNGGSIIGGAQLPQGRTGQGSIDVMNTSAILGWPEASYFADFYEPQVSGSPGIPDISVSKNGTVDFGPIDQPGDLTIGSNGNGNLNLQGTWYIHGNLNVLRNGSNGTLNINLNNKAMFVEGGINQETNSGQKVVQFNGPGVIIAVGDVSMEPGPAVNPDGTPDDTKYVYILSIEGRVYLKPRGVFVGSIAARRASEIYPSTRITFYGDPSFGSLNLPSSDSTTHEIVIGEVESWIIDDPTGNSGIKIRPWALPYGEITFTYPNQQLNAAGGVYPYTWSLYAGTLPEGLNLSSSGVVSGMPTAAGKYYFTAQAIDNNDQKGYQVIVLTVNVLPSIVEVPLGLPSCTEGDTYSEFILSRGGTPPVTWSVSSGQLPPGLQLISSTGNIVSIDPAGPTAAGDYAFTLRLTDAYGATDTWSTSILVKPKQ